jgi:hypothetical protein
LSEKFFGWRNGKERAAQNIKRGEKRISEEIKKVSSAMTRQTAR